VSLFFSRVPSRIAARDEVGIGFCTGSVVGRHRCPASLKASLATGPRSDSPDRTFSMATEETDMAKATSKKLAQFRIEPDSKGQTAQLHIEDDSGATLELTASRDQLDVLADTLDDILAKTEEADEV
jgi:hypothetical protein